MRMSVPLSWAPAMTNGGLAGVMANEQYWRVTTFVSGSKTLRPGRMNFDFTVIANEKTLAHPRELVDVGAHVTRIGRIRSTATYVPM